MSLNGFTTEAVRGTAVIVTGGNDNRIENCTLRNIGNYVVNIDGGTRNRVANCEISQTGDGGILLQGGDRGTLTPASNVAEDNRIHDFSRWVRTYCPAIRILGVGNRIAHNLIYNAPHTAIYLNGNDHQIEYNEIHDVCRETGDVGAFYMGRDWTERGNVVRHNYFHDIQGPGLHGAMGVYLDDAASGTLVYGNVFQQVTRAVFIGGGRDNIVQNNLFVDCNPGVDIDARGVGWMSSTVEDTLKPRLLAMPYTSRTWNARYPELATILSDEPALPKGNVVTQNISSGGSWTVIEVGAQPYQTINDNLGGDPHFVDAPGGKFSLRADSPALKTGFKPIPFDKIGVQKQ